MTVVTIHQFQKCNVCQQLLDWQPSESGTSLRARFHSEQTLKTPFLLRFHFLIRFFMGNIVPLGLAQTQF